ncbi:hypothetical protein T02_6734 [Trichinella nativa]|uniref:Uncharacterized protein n=1 Tax=Trichinella nativa TaxID=6335 RepID=A0A0V1L9K1_9BILA|nr:hypothetical protein T02_6734 [Trichinella nativa]
MLVISTDIQKNGDVDNMKQTYRQNQDLQKCYPWAKCINENYKAVFLTKRQEFDADGNRLRCYKAPNVLVNLSVAFAMWCRGACERGLLYNPQRGALQISV